MFTVSPTTILKGKWTFSGYILQWLMSMFKFTTVNRCAHLKLQLM